MITRFKKIVVLCFVLVGLAVVITLWQQPALWRIQTLVGLMTQDAPSTLPVPVKDVNSVELADTWGAPRSDNRRHEGIDIFAPLGRPVLSTTRGVVFKVGEDNLGGNVVVVVGPGWYRHYYAHLDRFADVKPGMIVQKGTVLGYVGNTGNARGTPPHLHYGVYRFLGGATNPYPLLARDRRTPVSTADSSSKKVKKVEQNTKKGQRVSERGRTSKSSRALPKTNKSNTGRALISRLDVR
jgi:murein DD-endopeptidase MepM/ murein hydrolase activator NlpD